MACDWRKSDIDEPDDLRTNILAPRLFMVGFSFRHTLTDMPSPPCLIWKGATYTFYFTSLAMPTRMATNSLPSCHKCMGRLGKKNPPLVVIHVFMSYTLSDDLAPHYFGGRSRQGKSVVGGRGACR